MTRSKFRFNLDEGELRSLQLDHDNVFDSAMTKRSRKVFDSPMMEPSPKVFGLATTHLLLLSLAEQVRGISSVVYLDGSSGKRGRFLSLYSV